MQSNYKAEIRNLLRQMQTDAVTAAEHKLAEYAQYPNFVETLI